MGLSPSGPLRLGCKATACGGSAKLHLLGSGFASPHLQALPGSIPGRKIQEMMPLFSYFVCLSYGFRIFERLTDKIPSW